MDEPPQLLCNVPTAVMLTGGRAIAALALVMIGASWTEEPPWFLHVRLTLRLMRLYPLKMEERPQLLL
jgi:hypothetical protein